MRITIAERLKPFCHLPGTSCMVPWSPWKVQVYPALIKLENLLTFEKKEQRLDWKGPVLDFTVQLDLEKGVVWVFGHTAEGYRRICIDMKQEVKPLERLSLGMHKALDWELVRRRHDMAEILPVWFRLGQMVPEKGETTLFHEVEKAEVVSSYLKIFLAGFEGILSPLLTDTDHQGIYDQIAHASPLILLTEGALYIRSLFFKESPNDWSFLPCLSPEFHAGRLVDLQTKAGDKIDFEWSKKLLQRVVIHAGSSREVFLGLPKPLKSFRLRSSVKDRGVRHRAEQPLTLNPGQTFFLDRFEK